MTNKEVLYDGRVGYYQLKTREEKVDLVYPNPKPELETISLGLLDQRQPCTWIPLTIIIDNREGKVTYDILKEGLELALGQYPWFAGNLIGRQSVRLSNAWLGKSVSNSELSFDSSFNIVPYEFQFQKAVEAILELETEPAPVFAAKATFTKNHYVVLTTLSNHIIADGQTIANFIRKWADFTCTPGKIEFDVKIPEPDLVLSKECGFPVLGLPEFPVSALNFKISLDKLNFIQMETNKYSPDKVSKEDIFIAFMWRIFSRAREAKGKSFLVRATSIHSRDEVNLGVGNRYICTFTDYVPIVNLTQNSIENIAQLIRSHLPKKDRKLSPELVELSKTRQASMDFDTDFAITSHRMFYHPPISFCGQPSRVHLNVCFTNIMVVQPTDYKVISSLVYVNHNLVDKILSDVEVASFGVEITVNRVI